MESYLNTCKIQMKSDFPDKTSIVAQIYDLRLRAAALSRRIEELEATTFQIVDEEEIILVAVPNA